MGAEGSGRVRVATGRVTGSHPGGASGTERGC